MAERKDYYAILGVGRDATEDEIKKKYRAEALKWHPDRWVMGTAEEKKTAEDKFKELSEAYNVLSDTQKRAQYDNPNGGFEFQGDIDPMDIFRHMQNMGGFDFGFGDDEPFVFGRQRIKKGTNVNADVTMTLKEAYDGGEFDVDVERVEECPHCHGTGDDDGKPTTCQHCGGRGMINEFTRSGNNSFNMMSHPCGFCHGTGRIINKPCHECGGSGKKVTYEKKRLVFPAGLPDGVTVVVPEMGNPIEGGKNGDMLVRVHVIEDPYFVRPDAVNVVHYEEVPFNEAMLGFTKNFRCVDGGEVTIVVPELTPHGKAFLFKGRGMPNPNGGGRGNYAVVINHKLPDSLTDKQREALKHFND